MAFQPDPLTATITLTAETTPELEAASQASVAQNTILERNNERVLQELRVGMSSREPWNFRTFNVIPLHVNVTVHNPTFTIA